MHTTRRALPAVSVLSAVLLLVVACDGGTTGSRWTFAPVPTGTPAPTGPAQSPGVSPGTSPGGSPGASPSPGGSPAASPSPGGSPGTSPGGEVIELAETGSLEITQGGQPVSALSVRAGETYTFRITNEGGVEHNFYIGPPDRLRAGDVAGLPGVPNFSSGTQEFTYEVTEETAALEFACTIPGHYDPMHGTFTVEQ